MSMYTTPPRQPTSSSDGPSCASVPSVSSSTAASSGRTQEHRSSFSPSSSLATSLLSPTSQNSKTPRLSSDIFSLVKTRRWKGLFRWITILMCFGFTLFVWSWPWHSVQPFYNICDIDTAHIEPTSRASEPVARPEVERWLQENSKDRHAFEWEQDQKPLWRQLLRKPHSPPPRPRAAIISLVRNEELEGIMQSMRQLEMHWNHKYRYPWIFFNEKEFSEEFKNATSNLTSAATYYELIPRFHWSTPSWINRTTYLSSLDYLGAIGVGKGYMLSYRHMCRWNSVWFYRHPRLLEYDYYWRVEPDVHFFCDLIYDPFRLLRDNRMVYGFNMVILDDARSFPSLWEATKRFVDQNPQLVDLSAVGDMDWLIDPRTGEYNNCQFFSNFEIGDLNFFRGQANEEYVRYLDETGGFFYQRFGDAPVHTLSLALFAGKRRIHFFRDIGYQHDIARHCPMSEVAGQGVCDCEPTELDENFYKLVPMESPQWKPEDTCVRLFLGEEWREKRAGWDGEAERLVGGDGYGGYLREG